MPARKRNPHKAPDSNAVRVARVKARRRAAGVCVMKADHGPAVRADLCLACWAQKNKKTIAEAEIAIVAWKAEQTASQDAAVDSSSEPADPAPRSQNQPGENPC